MLSMLIFFNVHFKPVDRCVINGKEISTSRYNDYGFCVSDNKPEFCTYLKGEDKNFISGIPIIVGDKFVYRNLTPDVARPAQRTAVGWTHENKIVVFLLYWKSYKRTTSNKDEIFRLF